MKYVFVINGVGGAGKDEFIKYVKEKVGEDDAIANISTSDGYKIIARDEFGWDRKKDDKGRRLLAELMRVSREYNDGVFENTKSRIIKYLKGSSTKCVFVHVREPEEIKKYVGYFGDRTKTILVKRDNIITPDNDSDKGVFDYEYDIVIENNSTLKGLSRIASYFVKKYLSQ